MKVKGIYVLIAVACLGAGGFYTAVADHHDTGAERVTEPPTSSYASVRSPGGFIAHSLRFTNADGEPEGRVFIEKDGRVIATIPGVRAVSFSPKQDVLLVREEVADDDLRHYLLNIGAGQYSRPEPRLDYVFGSRFVTRAEWSEDGKWLVLFDHPGVSESPPEVIKVADNL